jgi:RNase P/RNase MRP subunit POP5
VCAIVKGNRRRRYIGFVVKIFAKNLNKSEVLEEIQRQCKYIFNKDCREMGIRLIRFDGTSGILRCNHLEKENAIMLLKSIKKIRSKNVEITTIATSGTIRSLVKRHMTNHLM